jgi:hypothetical protein
MQEMITILFPVWVVIILTLGITNAIRYNTTRKDYSKMEGYSRFSFMFGYWLGWAITVMIFVSVSILIYLAVIAVRFCLTGW